MTLNDLFGTHRCGRELVHPRCAGLDMSKRDVRVCVRLVGSGRVVARLTVGSWGAVINQALALGEHLVVQQIRYE
jgi:transposase